MEQCTQCSACNVHQPQVAKTSVFWKARVHLLASSGSFPSTPSCCIPQRGSPVFPQSVAVTFRHFPLSVQPCKRVERKEQVILNQSFLFTHIQQSSAKSCVAQLKKRAECSPRCPALAHSPVSLAVGSCGVPHLIWRPEMVPVKTASARPALIHLSPITYLFYLSFITVQYMSCKIPNKTILLFLAVSILKKSLSKTPLPD